MPPEFRVRNATLERVDEALAKSARGVTEPVLTNCDIEPVVLTYKRWGGRWVLVDSVATSEQGR